MLAAVHGASLIGVDAQPVIVEARFGKGLPGIELVGLPETAVRESKVRVRAAVASTGVELPQRHVVLNLAPGDVRKSGSSFDLAIAVALLVAAGACAPTLLDATLFVGELSLGGDLRGVRGVLAQLRSAMDRGLARAVVPLDNARESTLVTGLDVRCAKSLADVIAFLDGTGALACAWDAAGSAREDSRGRGDEDLADVCGQDAAKRALEIAAAGMHHVVFVGPPGAGKTMLARRLPTILPPPTPDQALEIATIQSAAGLVAASSLDAVRRPFRAPHHTASDVALIGGGAPIRPGEVTLAHGGVLFLDELPEFRRSAIEGLRPTIELGLAVVSRARQRVIMPARPLIVAAMNPCPCGYAGEPTRVCTCAPRMVDAYTARLSGPLLDRFDLHVQVPPVPVRALRSAARHGDASADVRDRVVEAQARAAARRARAGGTGPARSQWVRDLAAGVKRGALSLLDDATIKLGLSARAYAKVLRVARTIADLGGAGDVGTAHVAEAIQYRLLDRRPVTTMERARTASGAR